MKLLICGATGGTGLELVKEAMKAGFDTVAMARDPKKLEQKLGSTSSGLTIVQADMTDPPSLKKAVTNDIDAVISALGLFPRKPSTELSEGTKHLIDAMNEAGVKRLICVSSWGAGGTDKQAPFFTRLFAFKYLFKHTIADKNRQETLITQSSLDYTIIRPAGLRNEPPGDITYSWTGEKPPQAKKFLVSRTYVAQYCLDCLEDDETIGQAINLSE